MTEYWWRSWHGAPMDHKWSVIAARTGVKAGIVSAIAWALLDYASQHKTRGTVAGFDVETYSVYTGFDEAEINAVISMMEQKGIITDGRFTNWEKRQPKREDDSAPRVAEHRARKQEEKQCNAVKHDVTQGNEMSRLETETDGESEPDTETKKETEKEREALALSLSSVIEKLTGYLRMPKDIPAIDEMVANGINKADLENALAYLKSIGKTPRGAADLRGSALTAHGKRIQAENNGNGHKPYAPKKYEPVIPDPETGEVKYREVVE